MTDATAQAAFKKAIAIDAAADQLMDASDQLAAELAVAAPGTAPMIEGSVGGHVGEGARADPVCDGGIVPHSSDRHGEHTERVLKFNANHASDTRRDVTNMFKK